MKYFKLYHWKNVVPQYSVVGSRRRPRILTILQGAPNLNLWNLLLSHPPFWSICNVFCTLLYSYARGSFHLYNHLRHLTSPPPSPISLPSWKHTSTVVPASDMLLLPLRTSRTRISLHLFLQDNEIARIPFTSSWNNSSVPR